jgi:hypothetical protein
MEDALGVLGAETISSARASVNSTSSSRNSAGNSRPEGVRCVPGRFGL